MINDISTPQQYLKTPGLVCYTCHPMVLIFSLLYLGPGSALIYNANTIPLLVKPPGANGSSEKMPISMGRPFLVYLQLFSHGRGIQIQMDNSNGLLLGAVNFRLSFHYRLVPSQDVPFALIL